MKKTAQKICSSFLINPLAETRGQINFCQNLIANLFEKGDSPCKKEFPEERIKRQLLDHYLKGIYNLTQQYAIYTMEISSPNTFHGRYLNQTDDLDIEFSKVSTEYIKNIKPKNSQRANSIFSNDVFSLIYRSLTILETTESRGDSANQTSRHTTVGPEIGLFSQFLNAICKNLTNNDITQHVKHDLRKLFAWFIIDYFAHNIDLTSLARKNFRPSKYR